jgi:hypothetical protein
MKHRRRICLVGHIFLDRNDKCRDTERSEQSFFLVQLLATIVCFLKRKIRKRRKKLHFLAMLDGELASYTAPERNPISSAPRLV